MGKWIAEFELEDGDTMPKHMDLNYRGAKIDFYCRPLNQEPCEDAISRQAVLNEKYLIELEDGQSFYCINPEDVETLPPVTPARKHGKWIKDKGDHMYHCTRCYTRWVHVDDMNYCPRCGADMSGSKVLENPTGSD